MTHTDQHTAELEQYERALAARERAAELVRAETEDALEADPALLLEHVPAEDAQDILLSILTAQRGLCGTDEDARQRELAVQIERLREHAIERAIREDAEANPVTYYT